MIPTEIRFVLRRHWRAYVALIALGLVVGILEAANLLAFIPIMNVLVGTQPGALGAAEAVERWTRALGSLFGAHDPFAVACVLFLGLTVVKGAMALLYEYWVSRASGRILHQYRREVLERLRAQPLAFFAESRAGDLTYSLYIPPVMISKLLYILPRGAIDLFRFVSVLIVLLAIEPRVTLVLIALVAVMYFAVIRRMSRYSYRQAELRRAAEQAMNGLATEWIHGIRPIRIAHADRHWVEGYDEHSQVARRSHARLSMLLAIPRHVFELLAFTLFIGSVAIAYVFFPDTFRTHLALIGLFGLGLMRVLPSAAALARMPLDIRTVLPDIEQLHRMLSSRPPAAERPLHLYSRLKSGIHIQHATAEYAGRGDVLSEIDLEVRKGEVFAIVGPSGSGKSSLLNLILGVIAPRRGAVMLDAHDIREIDKGSLFSRVGYVGQDVLLFKGTIRDNISFFRPELPERDIRAAAATAEIADFIESMPGGYDAPVGEGGVNLSGGQAQRIAIARAIVHDPDILLLDEATSSLDGAAEAAVVHALEKAARNRTVIMVTHRLKSALWADTVVVLDSGRIVAKGSWAELLADPQSAFSQMCREQQLTAAALDEIRQSRAARAI